MSQTPDILIETKPLNLLTEREKFFADLSYNPQFTYCRSFAVEELEKWGHPKTEIVSHSFCHVLIPTADTTEQKKTYIDEAHIRSAIEAFNQKYKLAQPLQVFFSTQLVSRCTVSAGKIQFQLPLRYTASSFADLCRHELETHTLRRVNHQLHQWPKEMTADRENRQFRMTEEGLATLHTYLHRPDKLLGRTYISYIGVYLAEHFTFSEMYQQLRQLGCSTHRAWNICVRNKRGIMDTSERRAFTKDVSYLEGVLQVWDWIVNQKNDPRDLYLGRLSLEQVEKYRATLDHSGMLLPSFLEDLQAYHQHIVEIGKKNHLDQLLKEVAL